jgi:para-nitrobenzyl esterase
MGPVTLAAGEARGKAIQDKLGAASIEAMRDIGGDRILAAAAGAPGSAIVVDGEHIIGSAVETFAAGKQSDVPVMLGFTRDERFANLGPAKTVAEYEAVVRAAFPANGAAVLKAYPATDEAGVQRALVDLMRDMSVGRQMFTWASDMTLYGKAPAYGYFFTRRQPYADGIAFSDHDPATVGAYHTGEVPYFLRTLDSLNLFRQTRNWEPGDRAQADTMSGAILAFARTGNPGWAAFDAKRPKAMMFNFDGKLIEWPNARALPLLAEGQSTPPPVATPGRIRD